MIPEPLKWVGAVLVLGLLVLVAAPMAWESFTGALNFSDSGGLIAGDDNDLDIVDPDGAEATEETATEPDASDDDAADDGASDDAADDAAAQGDGGDDPGDGGDEDGDSDEGAPEDVPDSYVVQSGDTLFSIAEEIYGDGNRWSEIAEANDIEETGISVGQELVIP